MGTWFGRLRRWLADAVVRVRPRGPWLRQGWFALVCASAFVVSALPIFLGWDLLPSLSWRRPLYYVVLLVVGAGAAYVGGLWLRDKTRQGPVILLGCLASFVVACGIKGMWGVVDGGVPFLAELHRGFLLLTGDPGTDVVADWSALQIAQLGSVLFLSATVATVVAQLASSPVASLYARFAKRVVLVTGLNGDSVPIIHALTEVREPATVVLAEPNPDHPLLEQVRRFGVRVIHRELSGRDNDLRWLRSLSTSAFGRRVALERVYLLADDEQANRAAVEVLRECLAGIRTTDGHRPPTRIIARIDRYRQARHYAAHQVENWQAPASQASGIRARKTLAAGPLVFISVCGRTQATAHAIAHRVAEWGEPKRFFVVGSSDLADAVADEWLFQRSAAQMLFREAKEGTPWRETLRRRAELPDPERLEAMPSIDEIQTWERGLLTAHGTPARARLTFVVANTPDEQQLGQLEQIAARIGGDQTRIFVPSDQVRGLARYPAIGAIHAFGLSLGGQPPSPHLMPDGIIHHSPSPLEGPPHDVWARVARLVGERYKIDEGLGLWEKLTRVDKAGHYRAIWVLLTALSHLGYTWHSGPPSPSPDPRPDVLPALVHLEHESWMRYHLANGRQPSPTDDTVVTEHQRPLLRPLDDLPPDLRQEAEQKTRISLQGALDALAAFGFTPVPPTVPVDRWMRCTRLGRQRVVRIASEVETWVNERGETMTAQPGDVFLSHIEPDGREWSISRAAFEATYEPPVGGVSKRRGEVQARPAVRGEPIRSREGESTAGETSWVLRDADGTWMVEADDFLDGYRIEGPWQPTVGDKGRSRIPGHV